MKSSENSHLKTKLKILVVDSHQIVLTGTQHLLDQHCPDAKILTAQTVKEAQELIENDLPDVVIIDPILAETLKATAQANVGIAFLQALMQKYRTLNIVVQTARPQILVRLKPYINFHEGGFTVADKNLSINELLTRVDLALLGATYPSRILQAGLEIKPEWIEVLYLAFHEGLQDTAIGNRMSVSLRTVRYYWSQIQNALGVYPQKDKNIRIQTELVAREEGLID
ncbi:response regulator transcription factor [Calothrix sp. FACHB-156]|nr:response regulator transcription factor [Calothrix sp. FACHB-156]